MKDTLVEQVTAAADRKLFDVGRGNDHAEDQLGVPAGLELEGQDLILDRRQHLGRQLLGGFYAHLLLVGLDIIHIGGEAGRQGPEMFPLMLMMQETAMAAIIPMAAREIRCFFIVRFILPIPKIRFFGDYWTVMMMRR